MLDIVFDDQFSVRRLSGQRDGHGKPEYSTLVEKDSGGNDTDVPRFIECFVDRRSRAARSLTENTKTVDATIYYNCDEAFSKVIETDLLVLESTGETFRVADIHEQKSIVEGSTYALVNVTRVKTPVARNSATPDDV